MDRREAIRVIEELLVDRDNGSRYPCVSSQRHCEALDLAIEALQEPRVVYCRNCKHSTDTGDYQDTYFCDNPHHDSNHLVHSLEYCSHGKPKEKHQLSGETSTNTSTNEGDAHSATTTDCISRQAAIDALQKIDGCTDLGTDDLFLSMGMAVKRVLSLPPVNQKQITGKLKNPYDSLVTEDSESVKEQKSKLESDLISRQAAIEAIEGVEWYHVNAKGELVSGSTSDEESWYKAEDIYKAIESLPPVEDMGEVSDGYHTFNQLYHQRAVLFATIVNQNKDKAWKSWKHEDGKFCFDKEGEWFIVGVDTPEGSYTYHYEKKYWDMFDCEELDRGKHWDGHTEEDVTRLLSLPPVTPTVSEDCISREQVRAKLDYISYAEKDPITIAKRIVDNAPSVTPPKKVVAQISVDTEELIERIKDEYKITDKVGEWIDTEFLKLKECSCCHCRWGMYDVENFDYCPTCGAKMGRKDGEA